MEDVHVLWSRFGRTADDATRNQLIEHYLPVVRYHAQRLIHKLPRSVEEGDLVTAGTFGLIEAISSFEPERGYKFETFCGRRVRGAMLDELRALDWTPRLTRQRAALVNRARQRFMQEHGVEPTDQELARELGIKGAEYVRVRQDSQATRMTSMSTKVTNGGEAGQRELEGVDLIADQRQADPSQAVERLSVRQLLTRGMSRSERLILLLYYNEEMSMKEIGQTLGMSESRISQIHKSLKDRLHAQFNNRAESLVAEVA
jgi:RNA polymerase sigma factor for flagellar operon FliA